MTIIGTGTFWQPVLLASSFILFTRSNRQLRKRLCKISRRPLNLELSLRDRWKDWSTDNEVLHPCSQSSQTAE